LKDGIGSGCAGGFSALSVENIWVNDPGPLLAGAAGGGGFGGSDSVVGFSALNVENICVNAPGPLLAGAAAGGGAGLGGSACEAGFSALSVENICVNDPGPDAEPLGAVGTGAAGSGTGGSGTFVTSACPSDFADNVLNIWVKLPGCPPLFSTGGAGAGHGALSNDTCLNTLAKSPPCFGSAFGTCACCGLTCGISLSVFRI
jgi:hypothetical protein